MQIPFIPNWADLRPFAAELWLIVTIVGVLLTPFFVRKPNSACGVVALLGLVIALWTAVAGGNQAAASDHSRLSSMLMADGVASLWRVILLLFTAGIVLMWFATTRPTLHEGDGPEFFTLLLGATLGMSLMGSAANLLMVFMTVEAASLPSYVLAGFRKTKRAGAEASLKYVLFGAASSAIMAYGLSLLYGLYGTLRLYPSADGPGLARKLAEGLAHGGPVGGPLLVVAVLGLICGLGFKIAAVPMHFWCPDVFEGASIDVTAFLSVASKGAGLVLLMRFAVAIADAAGYQSASVTTALAAVIGTLGAITCTVGNTAAYVQNNMKRLLAYSSIAHAGYMLCLVSLLVRHRPQMVSPGDSATQALLYYLAVYLFMNLGAFTIVGVIARGSAGEAGRDEISAFAGLGRRDPLLAACMTACLFSLIGLPPLAGFTAKFNVMAALASNGGGWWALVAVVGVNTVLSAYYYGRIIKVMYFQADGAADADSGIGLADFPLGRALSVGCAAALVLLFVGANPITDLTTACGRFHSTAQTGAQADAPVTPREAPVAAAR